MKRERAVYDILQEHLWHFSVSSGRSQIRIFCVCLIVVGEGASNYGPATVDHEYNAITAKANRNNRNGQNLKIIIQHNNAR